MAHTIESRKRALLKLKQRRQEWFAINGPCAICNSDKNLEVDHINPATKITSVVWSWKEDRRLVELLKCQVLCKVCHKKKTAREQSKLRSIPLVNKRCGTLHKYRLGCRCTLCRQSRSDSYYRNK